MNKEDIQLSELVPFFDKLQNVYGDTEFSSIYGAGEINNPQVMYIFMNPTGRNIAASRDWEGIRAPWLGTKQVWKLFRELSLIKKEHLTKVMALKTSEWDETFSNELYSTIAMNHCYITNFAKCTLSDARPLSNKVFKEYKYLLMKEIALLNPQKIITFGNQVSSLLIDKNISVSNYLGREYEILRVNKIEYKIFPTYYPVGQGQRNMPLAKKRLFNILST